jgi:hypothetical protein
LATINDIETSETVRQYITPSPKPVMSSAPYRNATIGGNLAHGDYQSDPPTVDRLGCAGQTQSPDNFVS